MFRPKCVIKLENCETSYFFMISGNVLLITGADAKFQRIPAAFANVLKITA